MDWYPAEMIAAPVANARPSMAGLYQCRSQKEEGRSEMLIYKGFYFCILPSYFCILPSYFCLPPVDCSLNCAPCILGIFSNAILSHGQALRSTPLHCSRRSHTSRQDDLVEYSCRAAPCPAG